MATYYSTSSNQGDVMPTLHLRDNSYQDSSLPGNMVFLNYSSGGSYSDNLTGNSQSQPSCAELPVPTAMLSQDSSAGASQSTLSHQELLLNLVASRFGEHTYVGWRDGRNEIMFMQPTSLLTNMQAMGEHITTSDDPQIDFRTQLGILHSGQLQRPNVSAIQGQGLMLSLSTQIPSAIPVPSFQYQHMNTNISFSGDDGSCRDDNSPSEHLRNAELTSAYSGGDHAIKGDVLNHFQCSAALQQMHMDPSPYGISGLTSTIPNSKYLKAAQQVLDEVVNVRKAIKQESDKHQGFKETDGGSKCTALPPSDGVALNMQDSCANSTTDLLPSERQDLQHMLTKLLAMLDEVYRRYKQYYHQMQIVVSSFDVIAGSGAAKPYTQLALQTISRHFRCMRDAISGQIQATRKSLGEQESSNSKEGGISRLRFVDQQLRQQRALQQIGMIQQHAWRPQRGLPESSVSILRAWLFEHFLHPYPKDSEKLMLARQTGLTRSQVSNWFINARVRLWKPMVEEIYKEEIGDAEMDSNSSSDNIPKARDEIGASEERCPTSQFSDSKSDHISDVEMTGTSVGFQNRANGNGPNYGNPKLRDQRPNSDDFSLQNAFVHPDESGRFMAYQMSELERFGSGGVSLTLGLQHCDGSLPVSGGQQNFVTVRGDDRYSGASVGDRFISSHLLHDFVV